MPSVASKASLHGAESAPSCGDLPGRPEAGSAGHQGLQNHKCAEDIRGRVAACAERIAGMVVVDAFCGVGGNAVHFARCCKHVIGVDNCHARLALAQQNARVYGVEDRLDLLCTDFFDLRDQLKVGSQPGAAMKAPACFLLYKRGGHMRHSWQAQLPSKVSSMAAVPAMLCTELAAQHRLSWMKSWGTQFLTCGQEREERSACRQTLCTCLRPGAAPATRPRPSGWSGTWAAWAAACTSCSPPPSLCSPRVCRLP